MTDHEDHVDRADDSICEETCISPKDKDAIRKEMEAWWATIEPKLGALKFDHLGKEYVWVTPESLSSK